MDHQFLGRARRGFSTAYFLSYPNTTCLLPGSNLDEETEGREESESEKESDMN